jgi:hypothetical protein
MTTRATIAAEADWHRWHELHKAGTGDVCPRCGDCEVWPTREGVGCVACGWTSA